MGAEIILQLCKFGGEPVCAGFFTGQIDQGLVREAMNQLSEKDATDWISLTTDAIQYDLAQRKFTKVSEQEFVEAFDRIVYSIPEADRNLVKKQYDLLSEGKTPDVMEAGKASELVF